MLPNLTIHPPRASDGEALHALVRAIGARCVVDVWAGRVSISLGQTLIAVQGEEWIGFVAWQQDEMQAVIVGLGVRANHRRFGVATALVNALAEHLRDAGSRLVEAVVPCDRTAATGVFEAAGFRHIGTHAKGDAIFERRLGRQRADGFGKGDKKLWQRR